MQEWVALLEGRVGEGVSERHCPFSDELDSGLQLQGGPGGRTCLRVTWVLFLFPSHSGRGWGGGHHLPGEGIPR